MATSQIEKLTDLIADFDNAMLVTRRGDELRSRPMVIGDYTDDGRVRFITRDDSAKLDELDEHPYVNVAMQGRESFLSISGNARVTKDRKLIEAVWDSQQAPWFGDGKDDPHVAVLEVIPTHAEFWDRGSNDITEMIVSKAKSITDDEEDSTRETGVHGDIEFRKRPL